VVHNRNSGRLLHGNPGGDQRVGDASEGPHEAPLRSGHSPDQGYPFVERVGQNKLPKWASSEYRNQFLVFLSIVMMRAHAKIAVCIYSRRDWEQGNTENSTLDQEDVTGTEWERI
jgi:hypothetical protein